ncbi:MAG: hypothetical protein O2971_07070 [Proteobacteria bacterium]|nr:hypothetical protein [Pseudomonadota bacterium]
MVAARLGQVEFTAISKGELVRLVKNAADSQTLPSSGYRDSNQLIIWGPVGLVLVIASTGFVYQQVNRGDEAEVQDLAVNEAIVFSPLESPGQTTALERAVIADPAEESLTDDSPTAVTNVIQSVAENSVAPNVPSPATDSIVGQAISLAEETDSADPVSDSSLALVTAAERGVTDAEIVEPQYEELAAAEAATRLDETPGIAVLEISPAPEEPAPVTLLPPPPTAIVESVDREETVPATPEQAPASQLDIIEEEEVAVAEVTPVTAGIATQTAEPELTLEERLLARVQEWVSAWESQSMDAYFQYYHRQFEPRYQDSQSAWRANRRRVIGNAEWIRLELSEFQLIAEDNGTIEVQFWLAYESPSYNDSTLKKLLFRSEAGQWLILEEINLLVRS